MKKVIKLLSICTLMSSVAICLGSCDTGAKVSSVKQAAKVIAESGTATEDAYAEAQKGGFFSLDLGGKLNYSLDNSNVENYEGAKKSTLVASAKLQATADVKSISDFFASKTITALTECPVEAYANVDVTMKSDDKVTNSIKGEASYVEDKAYINATAVNGGQSQTMKGYVSFPMTAALTLIKQQISSGDIELPSENLPVNLPVSGDMIASVAGSASVYSQSLLDWLSEEKTSEEIFDVVFSDEDTEISDTQKANIISFMDFVKDSIDSVIKVSGTDNSLRIGINSKDLVAYLTSISTYCDEQIANTTDEGAKAFYTKIETLITNVSSNIPTFHVTLTLNYTSKVLSGFGIDLGLSVEKEDKSKINLSCNFSLKTSFKKIKVTKMKGLDSYEVLNTSAIPDLN